MRRLLYGLSAAVWGFAAGVTLSEARTGWAIAYGVIALLWVGVAAIPDE